MQITAYVGHFDNGHFYSSGEIVELPKDKRVVVTVLDETPNVMTHAEKLAAWEEFKLMLNEPDDEDHLLVQLLEDDAFKRNKSSRSLLNFEDGEIVP